MIGTHSRYFEYPLTHKRVKDAAIGRPKPLENRYQNQIDKKNQLGVKVR
jgi:hypothetical protein